MTRESHQKLQEKLINLREKELPEISKEKLEAAEQGDLSENAGYEYAKQKLEMIQNKIRELSADLENVQFIEDLPIKGIIISVGTIVTFHDMDSDKEVIYSILGPGDAEFGNDVISYKSPLARGMITKKVGDLVEINVPEGKRTLKVLNIDTYKKKE